MAGDDRGPLRRRGASDALARPGAARRRGCGRAPSTTSSASTTCSAPGAPLRASSSPTGSPRRSSSGPPGTGKTTLARLVAERLEKRFVAAVGDLGRRAATSATCSRRRGVALGERGRRTILFLDEIHRFNRSPSRTRCCPASRTARSCSSARRPRTRSSRSTRRCSAARRCSASSRSAPTSSSSWCARGARQRSGDDRRRGARGAASQLAEGDARALLDDPRGRDRDRRARDERRPAIEPAPTSRPRARRERSCHQGATSTTTWSSALIKSIRGSDPDAGAVLAGPPARGGRGPAVRRPPPRHPGERGRRHGRSDGAVVADGGRGRRRPRRPARGGAQPRPGGRPPRARAEVERASPKRSGRHRPTSSDEPLGDGAGAAARRALPRCGGARSRRRLRVSSR